MNEQPEKIWKKSWNRPRYFFFWLALLPALVITLGIFIDSNTPGFSPPRWFQTLALLGAIILGGFLVIGVVCFVLSWIPPVNRLFTRMLQRRFFYLACLVTLIVLFFAVEDFRGKWRWKHYQREWEAKGEKFDLASFVPAPVPDDQNFAMTPLLQPLFDFERTTNGIKWGDTNGQARLREIQVDSFSHGSSNRAPDFGNMERGRPIDLAAWSDFYRNGTNYPKSTAPGKPAENILTALGKFDAELAEIQKAATTRPLSRFPIHYEDEPPSGILLPHLAALKGLCRMFQLRAIARLELRQSEAALADLQTGFRLSDSVRDEPFLIDHLVRIALLSINLEVVPEGLARHAWTDEQLVAIGKYLASLDILAECKRNMRGERAFNIAELDYARRLGFTTQPTEIFFMDEEGGGQQATGIFESFNLMPGGWYRQNMVAVSQMHQNFTLGAVDDTEHRVHPDVADSMKEYSVTDGWNFYNIFAKMMAPAFQQQSMKNARFQTYVDEIRIACALERYRLANGKWPETLDALVPAFMEKIPNDVIDGKPLRYRLNADGSYIIYSIGWNRTDDGGVPKSQDKKSVDKRDDWVWGPLTRQ